MKWRLISIINLPLLYRAWFYCKACHDDIKDETLIKKCKCKNCEYENFLRIAFAESLSLFTMLIKCFSFDELTRNETIEFFSLPPLIYILFVQTTKNTNRSVVDLRNIIFLFLSQISYKSNDMIWMGKWKKKENTTHFVWKKKSEENTKWKAFIVIETSWRKKIFLSLCSFLFALMPSSDLVQGLPPLSLTSLSVSYPPSRNIPAILFLCSRSLCDKISKKYCITRNLILDDVRKNEMRPWIKIRSRQRCFICFPTRVMFFDVFFYLLLSKNSLLLNIFLYLKS